MPTHFSTFERRCCSRYRSSTIDGPRGLPRHALHGASITTVAIATGYFQCFVNEMHSIVAAKRNKVHGSHCASNDAYVAIVYGRGMSDRIRPAVIILSIWIAHLIRRRHRLGRWPNDLIPELASPFLRTAWRKLPLADQESDEEMKVSGLISRMRCRKGGEIRIGERNTDRLKDLAPCWCEAHPESRLRFNARRPLVD